MKKQQRQSYGTEFKVKVVLEALKGQRTINELIRFPDNRYAIIRG